MKKNTKKNEMGDNGIISEIKEDFKRHTNVLMEQMKHEVKTVAEGHGIIIKKLEEHDNRFNEVDAKLTEHDKKFTKIGSELDTISMAVMDTSERVKSIENKVNGQEPRIKKLEEKVFV